MIFLTLLVTAFLLFIFTLIVTVGYLVVKALFVAFGLIPGILAGVAVCTFVIWVLTKLEKLLE